MKSRLVVVAVAFTMFASLAFSGCAEAPRVADEAMSVAQEVAGTAMSEVSVDVDGTSLTGHIAGWSLSGELVSGAPVEDGSGTYAVSLFTPGENVPVMRGYATLENGNISMDLENDGASVTLSASRSADGKWTGSFSAPEPGSK